MTRPTVRKPARARAARAWAVAGTAAACLLLAAACSSAPAPGEEAAQNTRVAVAGEYWQVLAVIIPEIFSAGSGSGQFITCAPAGGGTATQVAYTVNNSLVSQGGRLAPGPFTSKVEQLLHARGWSAFTTENGKMVSTHGDYRIQLQPVNGDQSVSANLTVSGPCVTVGAKFAAAAPHMKLYDFYANADVTASPTPTHPLPTP